MTRDVVTVWSANVDDPGVRLALAEIELGDDEVRCAQQFVDVRTAARFRYRRAFRRIVLGRVMGRKPASVRFSAGRFGKPAISDSSGEIEFSASHSVGQAWVAVGLCGPVGLDVQVHISLTDSLEGMVGMLAEPERRKLEVLPEMERIRAFFETWVRKEAVLKAVGVGLSRELASFDVPTDLQAVPGWVDLGFPAGRWWLQRLDAGPGASAALATTRPVDVRFQCFNDLLESNRA